MQALPVVARELRVASRRPGPYLARAGAALGALGLFAWVFRFNQATGGSAITGQGFFETITVTGLFTAMPAGVVLAADSLTSEKRDGTLGLLFLTSLRSWDVALGKLSATSLSGAYALIAVLPVMSISVLLGGVSAAEYLRSTLLLALGMVYGLAAGLAGSVFARTHRGASAAGMGLVAFAVFGPFLASEVAPALADRLGAAGLSENLKIAAALWKSPAEAFGCVADNAFNTQATSYWVGAGTLGGLSLLWVLAAFWWLGRAWRTMEGGAPSALRLPWRKGAPGATRLTREILPADVAYRTEVLDRHPTSWPSLRNRWRNVRLGWLPILLVAGVAVCAWALEGDWEFRIASLYVGGAITAVIWKMLVAAEAGDAFLSMRRSGAFELLLSSPITDREYVRAQILAIGRQFWPALVFLSLCILAQIPNLMSDRSGDQGPAVWFFIFQTAFLFVDTVAITLLGLWLGVAGKSGRAGLGAFLRVEVLSWVVYMGMLPAIAFARGEDERLFLLVYVGGGLAIDLAWIIYAWTRLARGIRGYAALGLKRA
jgi:ABC-type transport system involved in multi-copper enzyme maturation permease subunit